MIKSIGSMGKSHESLSRISPRKSHRLLLCLAVFLVTQLALPLPLGTVCGEDSAGANRIIDGRVHLIMVADTNDRTIGESVARDLYNIPTLFTTQVPEHRLSMVKLSGQDVRRVNVLKTIGNLAIDSSLDTVVFYFSGHGAYDRQRKEHLFRMTQGGVLGRSEVRDAIQKLRPQLSVIIADTCSTYHRKPVPTPFYPPSKTVTPAFQSLFLEPIGLVDINSSKPGQEAVGDSNGGWFTTTFYYHLQERKSSRLTWQAVLKDVNHEVKKKFFATQTAYALSPLALPGKGGVVTSPEQGQRVRFGAVAQQSRRAERHEGVEVTQVVPDTPATRLRSHKDGRRYQLVAGRDIITHINGTPISSYDEFRQQIAASPDKMVVRIFDRVTRATVDYDVSLDEAVGNQPGNNRTRFGAYVTTTREGVQVTGVMANSPSTRCRDQNGKTWVSVPRSTSFFRWSGRAC